MSKPAELREMNDDELVRHLAETREELFHLRFQLALGKQDNSARLGQVRRDVARALTLQRERGSGGQQPAISARAGRRGQKVRA